MAAVPKQMPGYGWKHMPLASAISYSVISIAITLINKAVLSSYCASQGRAWGHPALHFTPSVAALFPAAKATPSPHPP